MASKHVKSFRFMRSELRQAGFVQNNGDLLRQAISTLYQKFVDERLKVMRLKALERTGEDEF